MVTPQSGVLRPRTAFRRRLHNDEARALQMLHKALDHNLGLISSALWTRLRPWKRKAKASAAARSDGSAGVSLSALGIGGQ